MEKAFQTEGTACAKTQGHEGRWHLEEVDRGWNGVCA